MATLTNERMRAECPPHLCPGCFGWGFPIMAFNGREAYDLKAICPECNGSGRPKEKA